MAASGPQPAVTPAVVTDAVVTDAVLTDVLVTDDGSAASLVEANQALRVLTLATQELRHGFADALGVGVTDTVAMSYLASEGPLTPRDLARRLSIATSSVTTVVDRLERAELAFRRPRPDDRRTHDVVLTERGRRALDWARRYSQGALATLADDLPEATRILRDLAGALRAQKTAMARDAADGFPD